MIQFLVVTSQLDLAGRGVNGRTLAGFLRCYAGRGAVRNCSPAQLLASSGVSADCVFVGLPSEIGADHLRRLRYRRLVLFDLTDQHRLMWEEKNQTLLSSLTDRYLKTWVDEDWDFEMKMGLAPIRRYGKLWRAIQADRLLSLYRPPRPRIYDVTFFGSGSGRRAYTENMSQAYNLRVEWLTDVVRNSDYRFRGGLLGRSMPLAATLKYGDLSDLLLARKVNFGQYYRAMQQSLVALAPEGDAPWSYRHYEAIYAGAIVVTSDFRRMRTLIPLPTDSIIHVEHGQSVLPAIARAIQLRQSQPAVVRENIEFLERHLVNGMYSRRRPGLFDRFMAQLPAQSSGASIRPMARAA